MMKKTNFIWATFISAAALICFVLCETGLSQSQSEYSLIRRTVYHDPLISRSGGVQSPPDQVNVA